MARARVGTGIGLFVMAIAILAAAPTADAQSPALYFQGGSIPANGVGSIDVVLDNPVGNLNAYILAIEHDPQELTLQNVDISNTPVVDSSPEFISSEIQTSGGILTVIFDFEVPIDGHSMPPGTGLVIARYFYSCVNTPIDPDPATTHTVDFVDGVLGFPPINNVLNIEGAQVPADTTPGTVTCEPYVAPNGKLFCGAWNPISQQVEGVAQRVGSTLTLSFFYDEPNDFIQGMEFAIEHDERLTVESVCLDTTGSALESAGAEFLNCIVDNDASDDGCHFAVGVLLDALPPFDGQLLSPTNVPTLLGSIEMRIDPTTTPGEQLTAVFTPWTTIDLMFVVDGQIQPVDQTFGAVVNALPPISILRGDCNNDGSVDLADAIQVINVVFFAGDMLGCEEACNHNGDAAFDVADYVYLVNYFFLEGPQPPAPFPNCGGMPGIDCEVQTNCP